MTETTTLNIKDNLTNLQGAGNVEVSAGLTSPTQVGRGVRTGSYVGLPWATHITSMQAAPWSWLAVPPVVTGLVENIQVLAGNNFVCRISCVVWNTTASVGASVQTFGFTVDEPFAGWNKYQINTGRINIQTYPNLSPPNTWAWANGGPFANFTVGLPGTPVVAPVSAPVVLDNYLYLIMQYSALPTPAPAGQGYRYMIQTANQTVDGVPVL